MNFVRFIFHSNSFLFFFQVLFIGNTLSFISYFFNV
jgi:hypothetical protein